MLDMCVYSYQNYLVGEHTFQTTTYEHIHTNTYGHIHVSVHVFTCAYSRVKHISQLENSFFFCSDFLYH
jgi:hypothetical protein